MGKGVGGIEQATSHETAIEIIPEETCARGLYFLNRTLINLLATGIDASLIPIEQGGHVVGASLSEPGDDIVLTPNPMQMSHYGPDNERLASPRCINQPNLELILNFENHTTQDVVFAEAVVESQETILAACATINTMIDDYNADHSTTYPYPNYHTFTLVDKTSDDVRITDLVATFKVDKNIWVFGLGCDDSGMDRELPYLMGRLSPFHSSIPAEPYYSLNFS